MSKSSELYERDRVAIAKATKVRYNPMVIERGEGPRLFDADGRSYLDFGASWALTHLGYDNSAVREAVTTQLEKTAFAGIVSAVSAPAVELAERLIGLMGGDFEKRAWFGLSGSDAAEAAQRMVLTATGKRRIVSFIGAMHGTNDSGIGLSGLPGGSGFAFGPHVLKAPFPDPYRPPFPDAGENLTDRCLDYLENYLFKTVCPPEDTAAVFVETVQSDSGDVVPPPDFLPKLRALCDRHGLLLVVDDIKVGLGRTGKMFSNENFGVDADLLLLGKSMGGGLPLSAIVGRAEVLDSGFAGFTTSGNAACCAAGLATVDEVIRLGLAERSAENGAYLQDRLKETLGGYDIVGDVRGLGMIQGVDLVTDKATKEPNRDAAAKIVYRAWELGLILYYAGSFGNVIEITPPLTLTREEIDEGVAILDQAVRDYLEGSIPDESIAEFSGWFA
jgi:4-aminobutyrate aminotransferase